MFKILPGIPRGHILKVFEALKAIQVVPTAFLTENSGSDTEPLSSSEDSESLSSSSLNSSVDLPNITRPLPKQFPIDKCEFGFYAKNLIRTGEITTRGKKEITSEIIRVMKLYESHPTRSTRRSAINAFVKLGKASLSLSEEQAKTFWLQKVTQKLNTQLKQHRRLNNIKSQSKRAKNNSSGTASTVLAKRRKSTYMEGNDLVEMNHCKELLGDEFQKPSAQRNKRLICELMEKTFPLRRNFMATNPTVTVVVKEWPALSMYSELVQELKRIVNICSCDTIFHKIITHAQLQTHSPLIRRTLQHLPIQNSDEESLSLDISVIIACWLLCNMLRTNTKKVHISERYLVDICPENTTMDDIKEAVVDRHQPFVAVFGSITSIKKIVVFCEKTPVMEVLSMVDAVTAMFAYYFVFNYEYCPHVHLALAFLQKQWLKIEKPDVKQSVHELAMQMQLCT
uniref:Uncharacterized protein LOC104265813 n=1 Tax=Phallusia mammillata TaxID=59560 RepID=A0A6F9DJT5_9ASCI|nr:uncharacterized protein LOC104265813 [Phallusia mammillata]